VHGGGNRRIATRYGLSEAAVRRHRASHIPELLLKAYEASDLLADIARLRASAFDLLGKAERSHEWKAQVAAIREARENVRILAELQGRLATQGTMTIVTHPEWIELRAVIVAALEPYVDARESVLQAIRQVGNGHAG